MFDPRDLSVLLRSGAALVVVETHEESLLLDSFKHVMAELMRPLWRWSITNGLLNWKKSGSPALPTPCHDSHKTLKFWFQGNFSLSFPPAGTKAGHD